MDWGFELAANLERSQYSNDIRYLGPTGEALYYFPIGQQKHLGLGVTGGIGQFGNHEVAGRTSWSFGALARMSVLQISPQVQLGWDLIGQLKRPGDRALGALSPGAWIQAQL
jgi:hypothetical protein